MTGEVGKKSIVRDFWNRNVNQLNQLRRGDIGTPEFFAAAESLRFKYHYHLPPLFDRISQEYLPVPSQAFYPFLNPRSC